MPEFRTPPSRFETGFVRAATAIALAAALAGCAAQGGMHAIMNDEPTFLRLTEERAFAQALRQRYLELATNAYDRADFERSDFYSLRAIMAVEGKLADPGMSKGSSEGIAAARIRLLNSFSKGARTGSPELAARAQAAYDCWRLEAQPGGDPNIANACATNAGTALAELEVIGTGTRVASARIAEPQQFVVNSQTPSQTINAGSAMIEIVNQPVPGAAPEQSYTRQSYTPPPAYPQQASAHTQQRAALARTTQGIEPMESFSARTFVVDAPAPMPDTAQGYYEYDSGYAGQRDTVVPTVPLQEGYAPIDLIPDYEGLPYSEPVVQTVPIADTGAVQGFYQEQGAVLYDARIEQDRGGQYVALEPESRTITSMAPIYDDGAGTRQVAALQMPVYNDAGQMPLAAAPEMMDVSGDMLSTLIGARTEGTSDFAVYFGFDSDVITPEGEDVLADTVERLILEDRGTVALMGFTDSAGDSRYNQLLAMRRANAVRSYIQQRADRPLRFRIMPVGEAEAVKSGGDGVTEALNRRVEIMLQ